jgi:hypothetical protein
MKVIEQDEWCDLRLKNNEGVLRIHQNDDCILIDTQGATKLIEILKEFVGVNDVRLLTTDENGNCTHFHTTFGRGECFDCGKKLK